MGRHFSQEAFERAMEKAEGCADFVERAPHPPARVPERDPIPMVLPGPWRGDTPAWRDIGRRAEFKMFGGREATGWLVRHEAADPGEPHFTVLLDGGGEYPFAEAIRWRLI